MLVSMKEILERASRENYAVPAPNVGMEPEARAMIEAAEEMNSPIILDVGFKQNPDIEKYGRFLTQLAEDASVPIAINLDHGKFFSHCIMAIRGGFTSIMVDRSTLPFEENVKEVAELVKIAHSIGLSVEAELGHVGMGVQYDIDRDAGLTNPAQAKEFIDRTGVDCLAVAIGTAHGAYEGIVPRLDFERLAEIKQIVGPDYPLVLHGGSGTDDADLAKVARSGINKINLSNENYKAAALGVEKAKLTGNSYYAFYRTAKQAEKEHMMKRIELFGAKDKAWKVERNFRARVAE